MGASIQGLTLSI